MLSLAVIFWRVTQMQWLVLWFLNRWYPLPWVHKTSLLKKVFIKQRKKMLFLVPYNVPTPSLLSLQSCSGISVDSHFLKCVLRLVAGVLVLSIPINDLRAGCMSDSEYSRFLASCKLRELAASNYFLPKLFFSPYLWAM